MITERVFKACWLIISRHIKLAASYITFLIGAYLSQKLSLSAIQYICTLTNIVLYFTAMLYGLHFYIQLHVVRKLARPGVVLCTLLEIAIMGAMGAMDICWLMEYEHQILIDWLNLSWIALEFLFAWFCFLVIREFKGSIGDCYDEDSD